MTQVIELVVGGSFATGASYISTAGGTKSPASSRSNSAPNLTYNSLGTRLQLYLNVNSVTITPIGTSDGSYSSTKGVNTPNVADDNNGMIPIKWDGSNWVVCTTTDTNWYNYNGTSNEWANVMLSDGTYTRSSVTVGQVLQEAELRKYVCMDTKVCLLYNQWISHKPIWNNRYKILKRNNK